MPNYLHRTTKQYLISVSPISLAEPVANYIFMPDLSAVIGQPSKYWTITGDIITLMSQVERDAVDAALLNVVRDTTANQLDFVEGIIRAFALVVLDEINVLRQQFNTTTAESNQLTDTNLTPRTIAQLKTAVRTKMGI